MRNRRTLWFVGATVVLSGFTLLIDAFTPVGYLVGLGYVLLHAVGVHVVVRAARIELIARARLLLLAPAIWYSALLVVGFILSPVVIGAVAETMVIINLGLVSVLIWLLSLGGLIALRNRVRLLSLVATHEREKALFDAEISHRVGQLGYSAAMVENELQRPLHSVLAYSVFIERELSGMPSSGAGRYLRNLVSAAERATQAADALLTRLRSDDRSIELRDVWLENVLDRSLARHRALLKRLGARVKTEGFARSIRTDQRLLQITLDALLTAAIEHLPTDRPSDIRFVFTQPDAAQCVLRISSSLRQDRRTLPLSLEELPALADSVARLGGAFRSEFSQDGQAAELQVLLPAA